MSEQTKPEQSVGLEFAQVVVDAPHIAYVLDGGITDGGPGMALGQLLMVFDRNGWATLHRIEGFKYPGRRVSFGPRIPWSDGSVAPRRLPDEPGVASEAEAKQVLRDVLSGEREHDRRTDGS